MEDTNKCKVFNKSGKLICDLLLILIAEKPSYGYELSNRLCEMGITIPEGIGQKGRVYRALSDLEKKKEIKFDWDTTSSPPRKIYKITQKGKDRIKNFIIEMEEQIKVFKNFISKAKENI
ncbi:Transcriptional regulator PadR-like family protein [Marinitoga hydrogenitolerans DSM 16785]|uniref:Transcriptional regulator PadR-like family protein n=1 Tax=Marinitoga hydrogenitolerans (strain DSM 16785 / JCM 12826 / AT1271) TaxID=1122195 RepID=A0A1M4ZNH3_MARH1|nr:PadR family transcriptional regulator [Marinitoga hydrogenitolerans]SHF19357.1 Transcriptional regulator PadR-like family protein [Marinitoga hydrogenitolerans DSM 16785]